MDAQEISDDDYLSEDEQEVPFNAEQAPTQLEEPARLALTLARGALTSWEDTELADYMRQHAREVQPRRRHRALPYPATTTVPRPPRPQQLPLVQQQPPQQQQQQPASGAQPSQPVQPLQPQGTAAATMEATRNTQYQLPVQLKAKVEIENK